MWFLRIRRRCLATESPSAFAKLWSNQVMLLVPTALWFLCLMDRTYWFILYFLSFAIISFVQKGLLFILTNACYCNSRNLLFASFAFKMNSLLRQGDHNVSDCHHFVFIFRFRIKRSGFERSLMFMSWHLKHTHIFALLCPISNTNYWNLLVMEVEFARDATVRGMRLPTSSREAIDQDGNALCACGDWHVMWVNIYIYILYIYQS